MVHILTDPIHWIPFTDLKWIGTSLSKTSTRDSCYWTVKFSPLWCIKKCVKQWSFAFWLLPAEHRSDFGYWWMLSKIKQLVFWVLNPVFQLSRVWSKMPLTPSEVPKTCKHVLSITALRMFLSRRNTSQTLNYRAVPVTTWTFQVQN